jgi:sugar phosphate permease
VFFGWWMVAVAFLAQGLSAGCTTYLFGLFVKPVAEEFAAQRGPISLGMSLLTLAQGLIAPFVGVALDRRSIRATMVLGALAMGGGFALMAAAPSLAALGLCFATLIAFGALAIGPLSASKLVANWFEATRGRALGVASTGTSAGGAVLPPLAAWAIAAWGWRGALAALGALVVSLLVPAVWLLVRNRPEDRGLALDGASAREAATAALSPPALGLGDLVRQRNFWALGMAVGIVFALLGALLVNLHPYATDLGVDAAAGAWLFTLLSVSGIAGKLLFGALADRVGKRLLMAIGMAMLAGFLVLLLSEPDYEQLAIACALVGFALGGFLPIWGALIGDCWGREAFARVMGLMSPLMSPLVMAAVAVPGFVHDRTGSYDLAFHIFLGALALAGAALSLLQVPPSGRASQPI